MNPQAQLDDLKNCASKLAVDIIYLNLNDIEFQFQSGFCKIKGEQMIILDKKLPLEEQVNLILQGFENLNLEDHFIPPWIRDRLHKIEF